MEIIESRPDRPARPAGHDAAFAFRGRAVCLPKRAPWKAINSRELAAALGVHLQTLANWRVRNIGPKPEPAGRYRGNRTYYRLDNIIAWLSGEPAWRITADFLARHFIDLDPRTETETWALVSQLDRLGVFA